MVKQRFRQSSEGWPLVQVGPGVTTLNMSRDYSWTTFSEQSKFLYSALIDAYVKTNNQGSPLFNGLVLRYINTIDYPPAKDLLLFLKESLHIEISLIDDITNCTDTAGPPSGIKLNINCPLLKPKSTGMMRVGTKDDGRTIILEILINSDDTEYIPQDNINFAKWLDDAHGVAERWFFSLVKGELLEKFMR